MIPDLIGIIQTVVVAIAAAAVAFFVGSRKGRQTADQQHKAQEDENYRTTHKALDEAFRRSDGTDSAEWLRDRAKRKP